MLKDSTLTYNSNGGRQSAIRIKHLPKGTVQFEIVQERNIVGVITKEPPLSIYNQRSPTKNNGQVIFHLSVFY